MNVTLLKVKFFSIFLVILAIPFLSVAQNQGNIWFFSQYSGLDFSTGAPVPLSGGQINNAEGCSTICDDTGNILFYASPTSIWKGDHTLMPNGTGLMGGNSATQGVLIIPQPGSNERFYVFTLDEFQNNLANGLRYSIVDMCLNNGTGGVDSTSKNILLLDSTGEKMAATFHNNGNDIWLVTRKHFTNEFYSFLITSSGVSSPVISAIGWANPLHEIPNAIGQMKISPDGSKIAFAVGNQVPNIVQLFDFDNATGMVSNLVDLPTSTNSGGPYGVSFSPDNSKLYIQGPSPTGLNQFDLSSGISSTIISSLFHVPWAGSYGGTGLQLANNGKIYVCQPPDIGVINSPNLAGSACNFVGNAITSNSNYTFPGFIDSYNYKNGRPDCSTDITKPISIPNVFTPNNDGKNDFWEVDDLPADSQIQIFNRWGLKVTDTKATSVYKWDGRTTNGANCLDGTYYYIINNSYKGFLQLLR